MADIRAITSTLRAQLGVQKPSRFLVSFINPKWNQPDQGFLEDIPSFNLATGNSDQSVRGMMETAVLNALCYRTTLPSVNITTTNINRYGFGTEESMPTGMQNEGVSFDFIADGKGSIAKFLHRWADNVVRFNTPVKPMFGTDGKGPMGSLNYHDDYASRVIISVYNELENRILTYILHDAYPIRVGGPDLNWESQNEYVIIPTQFVFRTFEIVELGQGNIIDDGISAGVALAQQLSQVSGYTNSIEQIKKSNNLFDATNILNDTFT